MKIVQQDHPALRAVALELSVAEINSAETKKLLTQMSRALASQNDGVALAAPQLGVSKRIFIVSGKIFDIGEQKKNKPDLVFINPQIIKTSKKHELVEEGCLSTRWLYGKVSRASKVTVEALDEKGQKFTRHGSGLWAQIFQHEIDHLNGILFLDKAVEVKEMPPETDA